MKIEAQNEQERVQFFTDLYTAARSAAEAKYADMDKYLRQYKGSREIDGSQTEATHVRNITYELIESQITSYVPSPCVTARKWSEQNERCARSAEKMLVSKRNELPFEEMNDQDERFAPIYGGSVWLVEWDDSIETVSSTGDIKISCLAPHRFTGQPNIYRIDDMEYLFIRFDTTKDDIERKYGVTPAVAEEAEKAPDSDSTEDDNTATLYVCYYRDDDGNVCEYVWSGTTELSDVRDFYARKRRICEKCGERENVCECKKPKFTLENSEYEELDEDVRLSDGTVLPAMSIKMENGAPVTRTEQRQALDESGMPIFDEDGSGIALPRMVAVQVPELEPTKIPFYKPKSFPIVIRKNTSEEDSLFGQSDCEFIRPQQMAINKLESRIMQKEMKAGVMPYIPNDAEIDLDNTVFDRVLKLNPEHKGLYGVMDMQVDVSRDAGAAERHYDHAKRILGISDSFQGQYDSSAQSGKAKQMQIQQAQGRLDSKRRMKNAAYAQIDRVIFEYYLAYADEPRPAAFKDAQGRWHNADFNRYDFIRRDEDGKYYYDDEYLFSTDTTVDLENAREFIWQENRQNFQMGAYGNPALPQTQLIFWQNMERAHYPFARDNVERIQDEIARQAQTAAMQAQIDGLMQEVKNHEKYENMLTGKMGGTI